MLYSKQETVLVSGATSTPLVEAAPNRKAIIISPASVARFTISLATTAVLDVGLNIYSSGPIFALNAKDHGDIVTRAWTAISAGGSQNVTVVSFFEV